MTLRAMIPAALMARLPVLGAAPNIKSLIQTNALTPPSYHSVEAQMQLALAQLNKLAVNSPNILDMSMTAAYPLLQAGLPQDDVILLSMAVYKTACQKGISDFSVADYVDAIINAPGGIMLQDVVDAVYLGPDRFEDLLVTMAKQKRMTYTGNWEESFHLAAILEDVKDSIRAPKDQTIIQKAKADRKENPSFPWHD